MHSPTLLVEAAFRNHELTTAVCPSVPTKRRLAIYPQGARHSSSLRRAASTRRAEGSKLCWAGKPTQESGRCTQRSQVLVRSRGLASSSSSSSLALALVSLRLRQARLCRSLVRCLRVEFRLATRSLSCLRQKLASSIVYGLPSRVTSPPRGFSRHRAASGRKEEAISVSRSRLRVQAASVRGLSANLSVWTRHSSA